MSALAGNVSGQGRPNQEPVQTEPLKLDPTHETIKETLSQLEEHFAQEVSDSNLAPRVRKETDIEIKAKVHMELPSLISLFEAEKARAVTDALTTNLKVNDPNALVLEAENKSRMLADAVKKVQEMETQIKSLKMEVAKAGKSPEHFDQNNESTGVDWDNLQQENSILRQDNNTLRAHIANILQSPDQLREDSSYSRPLNSLNQKIQGWVPKVFRARNTEGLSEDARSRLLRFLNNPRYDPYGSATAALLSNRARLDDIFHTPRKRMILVRHIIALHLWRDVFQPFIFGHDYSKCTVEEDIFRRHSITLNETTNCRTQLW